MNDELRQRVEHEIRQAVHIAIVEGFPNVTACEGVIKECARRILADALADQHPARILTPSDAP